MSRKYTIEEVREQVESEPGYKLVSTVYKNAHTKIEVLCPAGHIYQVKRNCWQQGDRCKQCGFQKISIAKTTPLEVLEEIALNHGFKLLGRDSKRGVQLECSNGHITFKTIKLFNTGHGCSKCKGTKNRLTQDEVASRFESRGYKLLGEYVGNNIKVAFMCPLGHIGDMTYASFSMGRGCFECSVESRRGINYLENRTKKKKGSEANKSAIAYDPKHHEWRKNIYAKFDYTCQKCGFSGRSGNRLLNAHHIVGYAVDESLRYDPKNGICLCNKCHFTFHKTYGYKDFTAQDLEVYLRAESNP